MNYPEKIRKHLKNKTGHTDTVGMSGSSVTVFSDCVLKVEPLSADSRERVEAMRWLAQRLPVPKVLCWEEEQGMGYLLMERMSGTMACDEIWLRQPKVLVRALAGGLKMLWQQETAGCPRRMNLDKLLVLAEERVIRGEVEVSEAEPETFGEGGFRDPEALLAWLKENRPESVPVLAHGDYCLPNVFLENGTVRGFIDVGDMGIGEKWRDIALCWRSLKHNYDGTYGGKHDPDFDPDVLFEALNMIPDWQQIRYHLLLDELF